MAHVHVVIIGLAARGFEPEEKRLFSYQDIKGEPVETVYKMLSPYLIDAGKLRNPHLVIRNEKQNLMGYPDLIMGSKPVEGGYYIFNDEQKNEFLQKEPKAKTFFRPFIGAQEFINGQSRWILALQKVQPQELRKLPMVLARIEAVKQFRLASKKAPTRELAKTPRQFESNIIPDKSFLVIPQVSSERRDYLPIDWLQPPAIPSDKLRVLKDAQLWHFAILTSQIHMAWMRQVTGRLESRYMYSVGVVYNAFPWPEGLQENRKAQNKLNKLAQNILDARAQHPDSTLADLYNATTMPANLSKAHTALDKYVDKLYQKEPVKDDSERVAILFGLYENLLAQKNESTKKRMLN